MFNLLTDSFSVVSLPFGVSSSKGLLEFINSSTVVQKEPFFLQSILFYSALVYCTNKYEQYTQSAHELWL